MTGSFIGHPLSRVDGPKKVTGAAKYAAEFNVPGLLHGFVVSSTIARGKIKSIDEDAARALPGVVEIFTHENVSKLAWLDRSYKDDTAPPGSPLRPLHDDEVRFNGQPIALVVADSFELARYAATLLTINYEREEHQTELSSQRGKGYEPKPRSGSKPPAQPRGDAEKAFEQAKYRHEGEYEVPAEYHNAMEMFGTTIFYAEDDTLTVYDKTQGVLNSYNYVRKVFGYSKDDVRVLSPFVGGAFGSGLRPQPQLFLAVLAARELKRSVRVSLTRQQMFDSGHRPHTLQKLKLGTSDTGMLEALMHDAFAETSTYEDFNENVVNWSGTLYPCENAKVSYEVAKLDVATPIDMRAPGATLGVYALESAMDELSYTLGIDPLQLRLINYAERDKNENKAFSSKALRECFTQGAERFGWDKRTAKPRAMREGNDLIGYGMATGAWEALHMKASAKATLRADGKLTIASATADIGTGTYTAMTQVAADTLGVRIEDITFVLGDSTLPEAPIEGGSWTMASVGAAVQAACESLADKLWKVAQKVEGSPLTKVKREDVTFRDGKISNADGSQSLSFADAMHQTNTTSLEAEESTSPSLINTMRYTMLSHSAIFAEVKVDEALGRIRVTRVVSAIAGGRIVNPKTARSQILGSVVWGMGMALEEEAMLDHRFGRVMNHSLAEYHVPVNADVPEIDVIFVDERDDHVNPLGVKGLGEIGIVGVAAAIANAVYHATGKRVRKLPITLDKVM